MALVAQKTPPPEDDLDELPPLDGEDGEPADAQPGDEDIDEDIDGGDPFDDATGEDEAVDAKELDTGNVEGGWLDESAEADDLELGGVDLVAFEGEPLGASDFEEPGIGNEDFGLGAGEGLGLDGGEEGPLDDDEDMRDEDLPPLDADEEGEMDEADLVEPSFGESLDATLPWAARAWGTVGAPLGVGHPSGTSDGLAGTW